MAEKTQKRLLIAFVVLVVIALIGVTYAFFTGGVNVVSQQTVVSSTGTMKLVMNDGNTGWSEVWDFGESKTKTFTLQNTGTLPVTVDLYWKNLVNTFLKGSMVYSLKQTTDTSVETYLVGSASAFENIPTSSTAVSTNKIASNITVPANKTYTYTLTIKLVNSETVDQTSDLNANFYTEFDIREYEEPESPVKCLDGSGNEMTCPSTLETGQRIAIGDEVFRFIRYTSTSSNLNECGGETGTSTPCGDATNGDIRALAEYNLYVGHIYEYDSDSGDLNKIGDIATTDPKYGRQDSTAKGYVDGDSYYNGTTEFSSESVHGTQYSSYTGSIVEGYVEDYVDYLNTTYGITVSGDLITKAELTGIFSCVEYDTCPATSNGVDTSWIYTTSYWSRSSFSFNRMWIVGSDGPLDVAYVYDHYMGVRPVITIPASYFN